MTIRTRCPHKSETQRVLCLYEMADNVEKHIWKGNATHYPVEAFLEAKIWNGKSFWDVEQDIEWVDD